MSGDGLEWDEVYRRYEEERSEHWDSRKGEHRESIQTSEWAERSEASYYNLRSEAIARDEQRKRIIAAFHRQNPIARRCGWELKGIRPLETLDAPIVDIALGHSESGSVLGILVLQERQRPQTAITELTEAIATMRANTRLLQEDLSGMSVDERRIEGTIVISSTSERQAVEAIETMEVGVGLSEQIYLWKVVGTDEERIQAHTDINRRSPDECLPDYDLSEPLQQGIKVAKGIHSLPDFFVDSHHETIAEATVGEMIAQRKRDGAQITHFSSEDLETYLTRVLSGSDAIDAASPMVEEMVLRWSGMDLIESLTQSQTRLDDGSDYYRYKTGTQGSKTTIGAVRDNYTELATDFKIEIEARRRTLMDIREEEGEQRSLTNFSDA
ncbi:hypothetical protein [Haladaptatus sp. CMAA 1911]|uniref:hypothetical protein n=1 Tax=unclassified Haladaptatus TaxID=2622732 RepID=UPI0037543CBD